MSIIPSDIRNIEDARHWLKVNGYSEEQIESTLANWSALGASAPAPTPLIVEDEEEEWGWEDEDEEDLEEDDEE